VFFSPFAFQLLALVEFTVSHFIHNRRKTMTAKHLDAKSDFLRKILVELGVLTR
jgi:hypothetical protein